MASYTSKRHHGLHMQTTWTNAISYHPLSFFSDNSAQSSVYVKTEFGPKFIQDIGIKIHP